MSRREFHYRDDKSDEFWAIELDGAAHVGSIVDWEDQETSCAWFVPGAPGRGEADSRKALVLGEVDPVVISEVLLDLRQLAEKARA